MVCIFTVSMLHRSLAPGCSLRERCVFISAAALAFSCAQCCVWDCSRAAAELGLLRRLSCCGTRAMLVCADGLMLGTATLRLFANARTRACAFCAHWCYAVAHIAVALCALFWVDYAALPMKPLFHAYSPDRFGLLVYRYCSLPFSFALTFSSGPFFHMHAPTFGTAFGSFCSHLNSFSWCCSGFLPSHSLHFTHLSFSFQFSIFSGLSLTPSFGL